jgi:ABC-type uncharacterized transport system fused permease/ATPase subunit
VPAWGRDPFNVQRPPDSGVYFLPQRPYCSLGSLRDLLQYPNTGHLDPLSESSSPPWAERNVSDNNLFAILRAADDLTELPQRADRDPANGLDTVMDWSNTAATRVSLWQVTQHETSVSDPGRFNIGLGHLSRSIACTCY